MFNDPTWFQISRSIFEFIKTLTEFDKISVFGFCFFFFLQVQRSDPKHLLSQWHVPRPSANGLLCHKGKTVHDVALSDCACICVLIWRCLQAFVDFFSRGLQEEYRRQGIIIQVSCKLIPDQNPTSGLFWLHLSHLLSYLLTQTKHNGFKILSKGLVWWYI